MKWTEKEINELKLDYYKSIPRKDMELKYNRKWGCITKQANNLGLLLNRRIKLKFDEIMQFYYNGKNCREISELANCSISTIRNKLKENNTKLRSQSEVNRKYKINENYFDIIDIQEKAYILGLLYADGCNYPEKYNISLGLQEKDKSILEIITDQIQPSKPLYFKNLKTSNNNLSNQYVLSIDNKHISKTLEKLGMTKAKTFNLIFPTEQQVPKHLQRHFIRGYFDGDGCLTITSKRATISITGTKEICEGFSLILKEELNIHVNLSQRFPERNNNNWTAIVRGNTQIKRVCEFIYKDSNIQLDRKYQKYLDLLNIKSSRILKRTVCENCQNTINTIVKGLCKKCNYRKNISPKRNTN